MTAPETIQTDQGQATVLSYVASPSANGPRCMFDRWPMGFCIGQIAVLWPPCFQTTASGFIKHISGQKPASAVKLA